MSSWGIQWFQVLCVQGGLKPSCPPQTTSILIQPQSPHGRCLPSTLFCCVHQYYTGVFDQTTKRRKTGNDETEAVALSEPSPSARFRGHAQVVTGLAGPGDAPAMTLYSASLDRAVKTWDSERQDCVHTLNAPKAISCLDCSSSGRWVARWRTGLPCVMFWCYCWE